MTEKRQHKITIIPPDRGSADALIEFAPEYGNVVNLQAVTETDLCQLYVLIEQWQRGHGMSRPRIIKTGEIALRKQGESDDRR